MDSLFRPVHEKAKAGQFMVPGGYEVLKAEIERIEKNYLKAQETQELGPQFKDVLLKYQQDEVNIQTTMFKLWDSIKLTQRFS
jgi:hypothetical protein